MRESTQNMPNSPHIANPRAPSQYNFFFCSSMQFSECVHSFSMDIELRNDRIPRNPFDRQFLDMTAWAWTAREEKHRHPDHIRGYSN